MKVVKFLGAWKTHEACSGALRRQLSELDPVIGNCRFTFDPEARYYDWLVVYECFQN